MKNLIYLNDNFPVLRKMETGIIDLVYIDPPFNTGKEQHRGDISYSDKHDNYIAFLEPLIIQTHRILSNFGSLFFHIDYREVYRCKALLDKVFGENCFMNEIIWAYDYGGRNRKKWSTKHDTILWYVMDPKRYTFNYNEMDRIPYMAPGLVGKEKAARGKTPTDVWWHTIVPTNSREKTGYPTQKPLGILRRIIKVHSNPDDLVLDFFAGSGTTGMAALELERNFILVDNNPEAGKIMKKRFPKGTVKFIKGKKNEM